MADYPMDASRVSYLGLSAFWKLFRERAKRRSVRAEEQERDSFPVAGLSAQGTPMNADTAINVTHITKHINWAVPDVFNTMLGLVLEKLNADAPVNDGLWPPHGTPTADARSQVVGTVGFVGNARGLIYLYLDQCFAESCTCKLLGVSPNELAELGDEAVNDAVAELTNMSVGRFKQGLCDQGVNCTLTVPAIMRGRQFRVDVIDHASRFVYRFKSGDGRVVADILIKSSDGD